MVPILVPFKSEILIHAAYSKILDKKCIYYICLFVCFKLIQRNYRR